MVIGYHSTSINIETALAFKFTTPNAFNSVMDGSNIKTEFNLEIDE